MPYGIVIVIGFDDWISMSVHAFVTLMAHINSGLNPILNCLINPVFKNGFFNIFRLILGKPIETSNQTNNDGANSFVTKAPRKTMFQNNKIGQNNEKSDSIN